MELTESDRQRIEQEAKEFYSHWGAGYNEWIKGAEYATIYERQQQAKLYGGSEPNTLDYQAQHIETLKAERAQLAEEINRLREEKERMLRSIGNMLTALNQCGPEIGWNTSNYIEEAYAEHRKIFEASISPSSQTEL